MLLTEDMKTRQTRIRIIVNSHQNEIHHSYSTLAVGSSQCNMTRNKNKGIQIKIEEIKLLVEDILICVKNAKESTKIPVKIKK